MLIHREEMDQNCNLKIFSTDEMGKRQEEFTEYYSNNQLACKATYRDDKLSGLCKRYHRNGQLCSECTYRAGKIIGAYTEYYDDGKPHIKCFYKNGKKDGPYEEYSTSGKLQEKKVYQNGVELVGRKAIEYLKKWTALQTNAATAARSRRLPRR